MTEGPAAEGPNISRSVAGMGVAAAVSRAFGGLRMVVIAAVLGTTYLGNAFQSSNSFSNVLFELLAAGALSAVLVPTFVDLLRRGEQRRLEEVAGGLLSLALVALGAVSLLGMVFAPAIARLLTSGVGDPEVAAEQRALTTFLLRWFIPQVCLYAAGAVATGLLQARRSFALTAIAPIGNTVVIIASLVAFRAVAGDRPGLDLGTGAKLCLALGGTLGVAAFVSIPLVGLRRTGFRWRLGVRRGARDPDVHRLLRMSGWTIVQHAGTGVLLIAANVVCGGVAGGVVAYQLATVVFLAPYGIISQPIHTAVLPRLASERAAGDRAAMHTSLRWAADVLVAVTLPVAALLAATATPIMHVLALGESAQGDGPRLLAAALVGLAIGIPVYGAFMLLTRAAYAIGDSRTPALASIGSSALGAVGMVVAGATTDGVGRLFWVSAAHTGAFVVGFAWLAVRLAPEVGSVLAVGQLLPVVLGVATGVAGWAAVEAWAPHGRPASLAAVAAVGAGGLAVYLGALRSLGALPDRSPAGPMPLEPA